MDYEKILKRIVQIINTTENSDIGFTNICTYIGENCPELQKSEDERIRKELIDYINRLTVTPNNIDRYNAWITWLEKQGEKKNVDAESLSKTILASHGDPFKKPKWSEEDDGMMNHCIGAIHIAGKQVCNSYTDKDKEQMKKWLKSLKQRFTDAYEQGYKDAFDRAYKWLSEQMFELNACEEIYVADGNASSLEEFLNNFKKAMKERQ